MGPVEKFCNALGHEQSVDCWVSSGRGLRSLPFQGGGFEELGATNEHFNPAEILLPGGGATEVPCPALGRARGPLI